MGLVVLEVLLDKVRQEQVPCKEENARDIAEELLNSKGTSTAFKRILAGTVLEVDPLKVLSIEQVRQ